MDGRGKVGCCGNEVDLRSILRSFDKKNFCRSRFSLKLFVNGSKEFKRWKFFHGGGCAYDFVSSVSSLGLKPVANVEELIVKMLDGRVGMVGVIGRRVESEGHGQFE